MLSISLVLASGLLLALLGLAIKRFRYIRKWKPRNGEYSTEEFLRLGCAHAMHKEQIWELLTKDLLTRQQNRWILDDLFYPFQQDVCIFNKDRKHAPFAYSITELASELVLEQGIKLSGHAVFRLSGYLRDYKETPLYQSLAPLSTVEDSERLELLGVLLMRTEYTRSELLDYMDSTLFRYASGGWASSIKYKDEKLSGNALYILNKAFTNPNLTPDDFKTMIDKTLDSEPRIAQAILESPSCPDEMKVYGALRLGARVVP